MILFNNAGVSSSSGKVPTSFQETGANAIGCQGQDIVGVGLERPFAETVTSICFLAKFARRSQTLESQILSVGICRGCQC